VFESVVKFTSWNNKEEIEKHARYNNEDLNTKLSTNSKFKFKARLLCIAHVVHVAWSSRRSYIFSSSRNYWIVSKRDL